MELYCYTGNTIYVMAYGSSKALWRVAYNHMRTARQDAWISTYSFDMVDGHTGEVILSGYYTKEETSIQGVYQYTMTVRCWRDQRELTICDYLM